MNKHGQTLIIFILLLPIIMIICTFIFDVGLMTYENKKLEQVTQNIMENKIITQEIIESTYIKNKINIDNLKVIITDETISIENNYYTKSILGTILKIKEYEVRVKIIKDLKNNKIIYE